MTDREKLLKLINRMATMAIVTNGVMRYAYEPEKLVDQLIDNGVAVQEWISVDDRLPKPDEYVLCFYKDLYGKRWYTVGRVKSWDDKRELESDPDDYQLDEVTHWMPLPKPPVEG
jgi:hypothetical protein